MADELPTRDFMDEPNIKWRTSKPNYDLINEKYMREKTKSHKAGSLEKIVENLVKTYEMETTHKINIDDWKCIDRENYWSKVNGGPKITAEVLDKYGNYNVSMQLSPLYDSLANDRHRSDALFKKAFPDGFAWEVLEVFSGPPKVSFTWRHWAEFTGTYEGHGPTGEKLNMIGSAFATVTDDLKIQSVELFFDPNPMLMMLKGQSKCPVIGNNAAA